ncbi:MULTISPECIES: hypothetical protein [unclassified Mesorhizobium]|uniref:hypothetical protein n=1 Tax=unclassified Mesorhizobium TaxID=325217 RepID=UPI001FDF0D0D|nr:MULTISPECIES: hypothetical protein [unclassified Mesorhizobium]
MLAAILLTGGAYFLFSALDAAIKLLVAGVSVWQIMFFRSITILAARAATGGRRLSISANGFRTTTDGTMSAGERRLGHDRFPRHD